MKGISINIKERAAGMCMTEIISISLIAARSIRLLS